jgi:hypothetical protein
MLLMMMMMMMMMMMSVLQQLKWELLILCIKQRNQRLKSKQFFNIKQQLQTENLYLKQEYTLLSKIKDSSMME